MLTIYYVRLMVTCCFGDRNCCLLFNVKRIYLLSFFLHSDLKMTIYQFMTELPILRFFHCCQ